jgi:hypothetical protein
LTAIILASDATKRLRKKYGQNFPELTEKDPDKLGSSWQEWLKVKREEQAPQMQDRRLHWARHRNFRIGNQHISTRDGRTWREPYANENQIRAVINLIGPALDFRHGIIAEQRPGFRNELLKATIESREKAEAQQAVAEHYFHKSNVWRTWRDALYHAQTDGVCFVQTYLDKLGGNKIQNVKKVAPNDPRAAGLMAQGYQVDEQGFVLLPLDDTGSKELGPDAEISEVAEGDLAFRVVLAGDTFVDPEARTLNGDGDRARWFGIRRLRDIYTARIETGNENLQPEALDAVTDAQDSPVEGGTGYLRGLPPFPGSQQKYKESVYDWTVYIAPDGQDIEEGMWARLMGSHYIEGAKELPGQVYPFARFTDGSTDPSFYPRPVMSTWIGDQIVVNALASLLIQHARIHGLGRLMSLKGTVLTETYNTLVGSLLEYEGMKPEALRAQNAGGDVWQLFQEAKKGLEDKTGWNDLARGQVLGEAGGGMQDVSGRAVLGAREMLERTFGPMVQAAAEGATEWCDVTVKYAAWLFGDTPRMIPTVGGRGDLAKKISRKQLEGDVSTYVDAATMMPQPSQLRQQMLQELLSKGLITLAEYQKRAPYADIRNVFMGDIDHFQRAQWLNTMLEENYDKYEAMPPEVLYAPGTGLPILWQDDATVHLKALCEILLNERQPWTLRKLVQDRAGIYEQLAQAKADPTQIVPLEVLGVPLNRLQASMMMRQQQAQAAAANQMGAGQHGAAAAEHAGRRGDAESHAGW